MQLLPLKQLVILKQVLDVSTRRSWWKHIQTRSKDELIEVENQRHQRNQRKRRYPYYADGELYGYDDDDDDYDDDSVYEQQLLPTLKQLQESSDPLYVTSIGSSCSLDQLPIHDFIEESLFGLGRSGREGVSEDLLHDILPEFSTFLPIHDTLVISSNEAISTLCSNTYTSIILNLGGGTIEYKFSCHDDCSPTAPPP